MLVEGHYEILAEKKIETLTLQKIRWKEIVKKEKNWNDVNAVSSVSFIEFILLQIAQRKHHIFLVCLSQDYRFSWIICYLSNYKPVELWPKLQIEFLSRSHLIIQSLFEIGFQDLASNSVTNTPKSASAMWIKFVAGFQQICSLAPPPLLF